MRRKAIILLATVATLGLGVCMMPRTGFWMQAGSFYPVRMIDTLQHPVAVTSWDAAGLVLADGRKVELLGVTALPEDSPALRETLKRGVEVRPDGRVLALVRIQHWCGNDPVREHVAQVDLSELLIFLRLGQPTSAVSEAELLVRKPGGDFTERGWNISEFMEFELWQQSQLLQRLDADKSGSRAGVAVQTAKQT